MAGGRDIHGHRLEEHVLDRRVFVRLVLDSRADGDVSAPAGIRIMSAAFLAVVLGFILGMAKRLSMKHAEGMR